MDKFIRYSLKAIAWVIGSIAIIWIILWAYVGLNEKDLIRQISAAIESRTTGKVKIGSASVSLFRTFPVLSLQLSNVVLRDSQSTIHKKDFLKVADIYLGISIPQLLTGNSPIGKVIISNGHINILTDTTGYTNEYLLKAHNKGKTEKGSSLPDFILKNVLLTYVNPLKNKFHQAMIRNMKCTIKERDSVVHFGVRTYMLVKSLAFNDKKGSYLKNKTLDGDFELLFDKRKSDVLVKNVRINVDKHPFFFNGKFHIDKISPDFNLTINTYNIQFDSAAAVLNDTIQSKLRFYSFSKPVNIAVELTGKTLYKYVPAVKLMMDLDLQSVNNFGSSIFDLVKGKASISILMNGPIGRRDTTIASLNGTVKISDAEIRYIPRNFVLTKLNGIINFSDSDLVINKLTASAGQTNLSMQGSARNFIAALNKEPEKVEIHWKIYSPAITLNDFIVFLAQNKNKKTGKQGSASSRIDKMFANGDVYVSLESPEMIYKKFTATHVKANVLLKTSEIDLRNVFFNHAKGTMQISGTIKNGKNYNPVTLQVLMKGMDIPILFTSFDNFGQDALTPDNLKGKLTAKVEYHTAITDKAELINEASKGTIDFLLENGELNHFTPLEEAAGKIFKNQDFSQISFAELKNRLDVFGTAFIVNRMEIRSTALTFFVEGVYDLKKGTDMSISLPLQNLLKNQADNDLSNEGKTKKGVSVRLRARTGDDGKLKISWDPFKRSVKNKNEVKDSSKVKN